MVRMPAPLRTLPHGRRDLERIVRPFGGNPELDQIATGRAHSLFDADMIARARELEAGIEGQRVLVLGGAGSIGAATIELLLRYRPAAVHIVDIAENALA